MSKHMVYVWDIFVRIFHWSLVIGVTLNLMILEEGERAHRYVGYTLVGLIVARVVWGFIGSRYARFSDFFPTKARFQRHWREIRYGLPESHPGHNPLGALMIFAVMAVIVGLGISGYLMGTDTYYGVEAVEDVHKFLVDSLIALVVIHVAAVIAMSVRTRINLPRAMVTGYKNMPETDEVQPHTGSDV